MERIENLGSLLMYYIRYKYILVLIDKNKGVNQQDIARKNNISVPSFGFATQKLREHKLVVKMDGDYKEGNKFIVNHALIKRVENMADDFYKD